MDTHLNLARTNPTVGTTAKLIVTVSSLALLFFPIVNDIWPLVRESAPYGVAQVSAKYAFSWGAFSKRAFQRKVEEVAKKRSGLWKPFTQVGNQLLLLGFNQVTPFHGPSVFMGGDRQLVQTMHLDSFNRKPSKSKPFTEKVLARLDALKLLQEHQRARGKSVIAVISPNVAELYPETVPARYTLKGREDRIGVYELYKAQLRSRDITFVDSFEILQRSKPEFPFRMFVRTASHWNDVASCLVLNALNEKLLTQGTATLPDFSCASWEYDPKPRDKDLDLVKITNLLFPQVLYEPAPYVKFTPIANSVKRPVVTMAGSSYLFAFAETMKKRNLSKDHVHYFYYRERKTRNAKKLETLPKTGMNWEVILDRDITIVEAPMRDPGALGYGFIEDAAKFIQSSHSK